ncbi:MAG TPA: helix-turn-helix transcriptional regulator [bacterium]|nr:helix-turn-helix transcriptional regulator [bacterium]
MPLFRDILKREMKSRNLGIREFSRRVGMDPSFLSKILSGQRNPPQEEFLLKKIAEILEVDPDHLLFSCGRIPGRYLSFFSDPDNTESIRMIAEGSSPSFSEVSKTRKTQKGQTRRQVLPDEIL